jgi:hypothetical protein
MEGSTSQPVDLEMGWSPRIWAYLESFFAILILITEITDSKYGYIISTEEIMHGFTGSF